MMAIVNLLTFISDDLFQVPLTDMKRMLQMKFGDNGIQFS